MLFPGSSVELFGDVVGIFLIVIFSFGVADDITRIISFYR